MTGHDGAYNYVDPAVLDPILVFLAEWLALAIPVVLVALWFTGRAGKFDGLFVFVAAIGGIAISYALGLVYAHPPPHAVQPNTILSGPPANAFPSQHATAAFGMVLPLWYRGREWLASVFLVVAILVGLGRVTTGLHYPIDIGGGVLAAGLGFGVSWLAAGYVERVSAVVIATEGRVMGYLARLGR